MKVLLLSSKPNKLINTLRKYNDEYIIFTDDLKLDFLERNSIEFIVSFGYRKIIQKEIIKKYSKSIINLHISYLPYNRGSHPNLWSHIDKTPSGVTIHLVDEGIDTGPILFREKISFDIQKHTFMSSYKILIERIETLFECTWSKIKMGNYKIIKDKTKGSFHFYKEGLELVNELSLGWETNINKGLKELKYKK